MKGGKNMTNERAIELLNRRTTIPDEDATDEEINEAIDKAIEALRKEDSRKPGDWIKYTGPLGWVSWKCSNCKAPVECRSDYCPDCGSKMERG